MSGLNDYLADKRVAVRAQRQRVQEGTAMPRQVKASVRVEGRSGVRRLQIREFQVMSDSGPESGGFNLGPSPVELLLGALGGCLAHTLLIQAAVRGIPLDALEVDVAATSDPRAGHPAQSDVPVHPRDITYEVHITSPASKDVLQRLLEAAEQVCPITSLLAQPQVITGSLSHTPTEPNTPPVTSNQVVAEVALR